MSALLFKMHYVIIILLTQLAYMVLYSISFKYNRVMKTEKEIKIEEKIARKKKKKSKDRRNKAHLSSMIQDSSSRETDVQALLTRSKKDKLRNARKTTLI